MLKREILSAIASEVQTLLLKKNADYGNSYFELREEFGEIAFIVRLVDKVARLKTLMKQDARVEESKKEGAWGTLGY
ncbi:hypothetical protein V4D30_01140 [Thermodesulfovibrio sp. 3907-1M]|uniref:Uncharacterized protein n=1 Tax=Thermodesulfovibrio autotrophicus TaxID=3118333 RepID=A0AAU8GXF5_9BACT